MQALRTTALVTMSITTLAAADPVEGVYSDVAGCDDHGDRTSTEEFGDPSVFQQSQWILHSSTLTQRSACPDSDDPNVPNALVSIINETGRPLRDLFYVGDANTLGVGNTTFSNQDGVASQLIGDPPLAGMAFRIDSIGMNRPLILETMTPDGVFEPFETWQFIVQDYRNDLGIPADAFFSVGYADGSDVGGSSASIVQFVPAPGSLALLGLGSLCCLRRRR